MSMLDKLKELKDFTESVADAITKDVTSVQSTREYKFEDFKKYVKKRQREIPQITKCTIAVDKRTEFDNVTFASERYVIRIVMLDVKKNPILFDGKEDEYVGTVVIADAIDDKLKEFMGDDSVKTVKIGGK